MSDLLTIEEATKIVGCSQYTFVDLYNETGDEKVKNPEGKLTYYKSTVEVIKSSLERKSLSFQKELKELLSKYQASIGVDFDECSDLYGVTGERIVASLPGINIDLGCGYHVYASDIEVEY